MFSRQTHRKSRNGCLICKGRHIKCGEEQPRCQNCIDYDLQCHYRAVPPLTRSASSALPLRSLAPGNKASRSSLVRSSSADTTSSNSVSSASVENGSGNQPSIHDKSFGKPDLNITDLELLHHFSTVTYITMSNVPEEQSTWQTTMVRIGFKYPFLLHGLLAFSALHLSYLDPAQSAGHLLTASAHQDRAISEFREIFTSINPSTFDPILAFSCLLPLHSLANTTVSRLRTHVSDFETLTSFLSSVRLLRGVNIFLPSGWLIPPSSCLICLAQVALQNLPEASTYPGLEAIDRLEQACSSFLAKSSYPSPALHIFTDAIALLRSTFARLATETASDQFTVGIILLWMYDVSEHFIKLLCSSHDIALAILAYYATLLYQQRRVWWIEGLGSALIAAISDILGSEWREVLAWPKEVANITQIDLGVADS